MNTSHVVELAFKQVCEQNNQDSNNMLLPVALLVSADDSAKGEVITRLNHAVSDFVASLAVQSGHTHLKFSLLSSNSYPIVYFDFKKLTTEIDLPLLVAKGHRRALAQGSDLASNMLLTNKRDHQKKGKSVLCPWLITVTNGEATDVIADTQKRLEKYVQSDEIFHILINLSPNAMPEFKAHARFDITSGQLKECFTWLSDIIAARLQSNTALKIKPPAFI